MNIKKLLIIISLILCVNITAHAQEMENSSIKNGKRVEFGKEFSIFVPDDFEFSEVEQDDFANSKVYEYESSEERVRVIISEQKSTDANFESLDYLIRKDLDYKLLSNEQLLIEYETFKEAIDDSVPVYMDYLPVSSVSVDDRLALVCSAYYTDNESYATGMIKAYRFYYMGNLITLYYDTLIEGNYYNEKAYVVFDEIAGSIDFDNNPAANVSNPAVISRVISNLIQPLAVVAVALFIGIALGILTKGSKGKRVKGVAGEDVEKAPIEVETPKVAVTSALDESLNIAAHSSVDETNELEESDEEEPLISLEPDEGADWNALFEQVKADNKVVHEKQMDIGSQPKDIQKNEMDDYEVIVESKQDYEAVHVEIENGDALQHIEIEQEKEPIEESIEQVHMQDEQIEPDDKVVQQNIDDDIDDLHSDYVKQLLKRQEEQDEFERKKRESRDMNNESSKEFEKFDIDSYDLFEEMDTISAKRKKRMVSLEQEIDSALSIAKDDDIGEHELANDVYDSEDIPLDNKQGAIDNRTGILETDNEIFEALKRSSEYVSEVKIDRDEYEKMESQKEKEKEEELDDNKDFFTSKLIRRKKPEEDAVDNEYIDRMLPEKNKAENKKNIKALQKEVLTFLHDEISEKAEKASQVQVDRRDKQNLKGASKFLNSIVNRIVSDGRRSEDEILADVESRNELHRSEKIDNNKFDELIPGITDAYKEKEVVEIVMDEYEEIKYLDKEEDKNE